MKKIDRIIPPPPVHFVGDGFRVHNFIPGVPGLGMHRMNPFIMLDYNSKFYFPPSETPRGVSVHPHRGFETVTIAYSGKVAHHDSAGHSGVIGEGDVQWMTAASGILHKEYHQEEFSRKGGDFEMVQLWVNLPAKFKMSSPKYQGLLNETLGKFQIENNGGVVEIIAGEYHEIKGPATTFTPLHVYNAKMNSGAEISLNFPERHNTALLVINGSIMVNNDSIVSKDNLVLFSHEGSSIIIKAESDSIVLILSGEPINEPIFAYGPFVMNSQEELAQAFNDYNEGKFGFLED